MNFFRFINQNKYSLLFVLFLAVTLLFHPIESPDTWKHMVDGKYIKLFNAFPHYSTFTFAPVKDFIPGDTYDWLGSLILISLYNWSGYNGLFLFQFLIPLPFVFLLYSIYDGKAKLSWLISSLIVTIMLTPKFYARSAGFSPIFLGVLLLCLWKIIDDKSIPYLYGIPPLLTFWGNIHGSYLMGIYVLAFFTGGSIIDSLIKKNSYLNFDDCLKLLLITSLSLLSVIYIKPYRNYEPLNRISKLITLFHSNERSQTNNANRSSSFMKSWTHDVIVEDRPTIAEEYHYTFRNLRRLDRIVPLLLIPLLYVSIVFWTFGSVKFSILLPILFLLWLGSSVVRAIPLSTSSMFVLTLLELQHHRSVIRKPLEKKLLAGVLVIICSFVMIFSPSTDLNRSKFVWDGNPQLQSSLPINLLKNHPEKKVFTLGNGSFVLWNWWPFKKVFFQAKTTAFEEHFLWKLHKQRSTPSSAYRTFEKFDFQLALLSKDVYNNGQNLFHIHPEWNIVSTAESSDTMFLYCRCEPENLSLRNSSIQLLN